MGSDTIYKGTDKPQVLQCRATHPWGSHGLRRRLEATRLAAHSAPLPQTLFFRADTGKAFTMVLAGFAFTITTFPKTSRLPAFVAGFNRVFTMQSPGNTNLPAFFTSFVATPARLLITFMHSDFFSSVSEAKASAKPPLVMGFAPDFIAFIGAMVAGRKTRRGDPRALL